MIRDMIATPVRVPGTWYLHIIHQRREMNVLTKAAKARLKREIAQLRDDPPPGIIARLESEDNIATFIAEIEGPPNSPFADAVFTLTIQIPSRYPFEPPSCRFSSVPSPYHPNIDASGRICLDTLKSPPTGTWSPAVSLATLLLSIQSLLAEPNPDDGLVPEISNLYRFSKEKWIEEARRRSTTPKDTDKLPSKNEIGSDDIRNETETCSKRQKTML
jgi:ubiquitin-conjugating enzyme E2 T